VSKTCARAVGILMLLWLRCYNTIQTDNERARQRTMQKHSFTDGETLTHLYSVHLLRSISNLIRCLRRFLILTLLHSALRRNALCIATNKLPHNLDSRSRTSRLSSQDLSRLVDDEDTALCSLGCLLRTTMCKAAFASS
jgi:hypothetical protein